MQIYIDNTNDLHYHLMARLCDTSQGAITCIWNNYSVTIMKTSFMKILLLFLVLSSSLALISCSNAPGQKNVTPQNANSNYIHTIELNSEIQLSGLVEKLLQADYILLGEAHGNPEHHRLQQKILALLIKGGRQPAVVFEMFDREDEGLISTTTRRYPYEPDRIAIATGWEQSGWPDWQLYRPIVETALLADLQVVAGNLSRARARQLIINYLTPVPNDQAQILEDKTRMQMGLFAPLPKDREQMLYDKIQGVHNKGFPDKVIEAMVMAQRMRDATMAEAMIARNQGQGAVLITGHEHARLDYGVPHYLRFREPDARIISLTFVDQDDVPDNMNELAKQFKNDEQRVFDYVWVLPEGKNRLIAQR